MTAHSALAIEASGLVKTFGSVRAVDQWAAGGDLRKRLLAAFNEHGIEIPRPQRVVLAREPEALEVDVVSKTLAQFSRK